MSKDSSSLKSKFPLWIGGHVSGRGRTEHREFIMASGEMNSAAFTLFLKTVFGHLAKYSIDGSIHEIAMDWRHMEEMLVAGRSAFVELKNVVVWNKDNAGMGTFYRSKHELIFVWKNGTAPHINTFELGQYGRHRSNVWDYRGVNSFQTERMTELESRPTVKPVAPIADAIKDFSKPRDIVLDPFVGSGTSLIAAEKTGRRARCIEFDPIYVDVAVMWWEAYTGRTAVLADTEQTFEELAEARTVSLSREY